VNSSAFSIAMPDVRSTPVVFASPHSGRNYPWSFIRNSSLDEITIRTSEDAFVDRLFDCAPSLGAPLLAANVPRAFVDVNRSADELDPALIAGVKQRGHNPRISSGLGVIPRVVAGGQVIRAGKISRYEAMARLDDCYYPYHAALKTLLDEAHAQFGRAILFDCHSMPHEAIVASSHPTDQRPDIVLGDRFGSACDSSIVEAVERIFAHAGLKTARNLPFAGAYVTQHYGRPSRQQHVLQIEIDRAVYLNELKIQPNANFAAFRSVIQTVVSKLVDIGKSKRKLAAE